MIGRREFIALIGGGAASWPLAAAAQQRERMRLIGILNTLPQDHPAEKSGTAVFRTALAELNWVEGRNVRFEQRWYQGDNDRLDKDAAELVALAPDVIMTTGAAGLDRLLRVTRTVPIVFVLANDPVARGLVASLARPGGNATGFSHFEYQTGAKWPELLKQIAPHVTRVAVMGGNPANFDSRGQWDAIQAVGPLLGLEVTRIEVMINTGTSSDASDIEREVATFATGPNCGLIVTQNLGTILHHKLIVALAAQHRLPAIYYERYFADEGGLISYSPSVASEYRGAAGYVDRILKGTKPADLPVRAPTKFELVINLKTAKTLGLNVPASMQQLADEVIE